MATLHIIYIINSTNYDKHLPSTTGKLKSSQYITFWVRGGVVS